MMSVDDFQVKYGRLPTETDKDWLKELERARSLAKLQLLDAALLAPGKCGNCGYTSPWKQEGDRKFFDFGLTLEFYGTLYLCTTCIREAAILAGLFIPAFVPPVAALEGEVEEALDNFESGNDKLVELSDRIAALQESIDGHLDWLRGNNSVSSNSDPARAVSSLDSETSGGQHSKDVKGTFERGTKPSSKPRSKDVPSLAELLGGDKTK